MLCAAAVALIVSHDAGAIAGVSNEAFARLVAGLALVVFLGSALLGAYRGRIGNAARDIAAWLLLMLLLVGVYAYRAELLTVAERVAGELLPRGSQMSVNASARHRPCACAAAGTGTLPRGSRSRGARST